MRVAARRRRGLCGAPVTVLNASELLRRRTGVRDDGGTPGLRALITRTMALLATRLTQPSLLLKANKLRWGFLWGLSFIRPGQGNAQVGFLSRVSMVVLRVT